MSLRFGLAVLSDAPFAALAERWRAAEELGFDHLYIADHVGHPYEPGGAWLDATVALALAARETRSIRLGSLVSNPIVRPPVLLAREAHALDHASGGRFELGIGAGALDADHAATGSDPWPPRERAARFEEYVRLVDELLTHPSRAVSFEGAFHRSSGVAMVPPTPQRPRPPLTLAGQSPTVVRVAAELADCWNTPGRPGEGLEETLAATARHNARLDELCRAAGRDPGALRRSVLLNRSFGAWSAPDALERLVPAFQAVGISEFVMLCPPEPAAAALQRIGEVMRAARS